MIQRYLSLFFCLHHVYSFFRCGRALSYVFLSYYGFQVLSISCYLRYDLCQGYMLLSIFSAFGSTSYIEVSLTCAFTPRYMVVSVQGGHIHVRSIRKRRSQVPTCKSSSCVSTIFYNYVCVYGVLQSSYVYVGAVSCVRRLYMGEYLF